MTSTLILWCQLTSTHGHLHSRCNNSKQSSNRSPSSLWFGTRNDFWKAKQQFEMRNASPHKTHVRSPRGTVTWINDANIALTFAFKLPQTPHRNQTAFGKLHQHFVQAEILTWSQACCNLLHTQRNLLHTCHWSAELTRDTLRLSQNTHSRGTTWKQKPERALPFLDPSKLDIRKLHDRAENIQGIGFIGNQSQKTNRNHMKLVTENKNELTGVVQTQNYNRENENK